MRDLPAGTVTFLFSDIEGSTRLLGELGAELYAEALAGHRRLMREAFTAHGGVEVDTEGDAFFVAFPDAAGALAAAGDAQAALAGGPVRVRMGVHTGTPLVTAEGYVGIDVHRGARVMSAGHGGQVLISEATCEQLDGAVALTDLGLHRLKDLSEPQRLWQLGATEFPPLKTLYQTNLPLQPTPLVGREAELAELLELSAGSRLVTLTGAGGSGKTRLALQASAELVDGFKDGVWWVSLGALRDPALVEPTIAQTVGAKNGLVEHMRSRRTLLLLDNFEQLLGAATVVADLLREAPGLQVLATSRERLRVAGEQEYPVPPMVPDEALALFAARARELTSDFVPDETVGEICRRLDGLPLAVELAAARIKVLRPEQILARLGRSLDLLTAGARDAPERQQTLRATIDWSYELLDQVEKGLVARLAVFAASFDLDAAEAVADADIDALAALVDKSLLLRRPGPHGDSRLLMPETVREYASERLEARADAADVHRRHCEHYHALARRIEPDLFTHREAESLPRLDIEVDNLRAALDWSLVHDPLQALDLVGALTSFWTARNAFGEGLARIEVALAAAGDDAPASSRGNALTGRAFLVANAGSIFDREGSVKRARASAVEALALFREIGDHSGAGYSLMAQAWLEQGESMPQRRRLAFAEQAVHCAREAGDSRLAAMALSERALALPPEQAGEELERAAKALREVGDTFNLVMLYRNAAHTAIKSGSAEQAGPLLERAVALARGLQDPDDLMLEPPTEGLYALFVGDLDRAQAAFEEQLRFSLEHALPAKAPGPLAGVAAIAARREQDQRAAQLLGAAAAIGPIDDADVVRQLDDRFFMPARARLREPPWDEALAAGARLSFEEVIALALEPDEQSVPER